jgi:HSP20 family protein
MNWHSDDMSASTLPFWGLEGGENMTKLVRWDPFRLPSFLDDFEDFGSSRGLKLRETDSSIVAEAVVAGVAADDVEVHIEDGVLTIKAEGKKENEKEGKHVSSSYRYYYTAALANGAWDKAEAEVENGVCIVTIPKAESARPRKIAVRQKNIEK